MSMFHEYECSQFPISFLFNLHMLCYIYLEVWMMEQMILYFSKYDHKYQIILNMIDLNQPKALCKNNVHAKV